jgi:hypothetical protein
MHDASAIDLNRSAFYRGTYEISVFADIFSGDAISLSRTDWRPPGIFFAGCCTIHRPMRIKRSEAEDREPTREMRRTDDASHFESRP